MDAMQIEPVPSAREGVRLLKLIGPFTLSTMFDFQSLIREHVAPTTIIDLSAVPYMDSASLGALLGFHVSCQREGRKYALIAPSERLKTLFKVAGVEGILTTYDSVEAAEASLQ